MALSLAISVGSQGNSKISWDESTGQPILSVPLNLKLPLSEMLAALVDFQKMEPPPAMVQQRALAQKAAADAKAAAMQTSMGGAPGLDYPAAQRPQPPPPQQHLPLAVGAVDPAANAQAVSPAAVVNWDNPIADLHSGMEEYANRTKWKLTSENIVAKGAWSLIDDAPFCTYEPRNYEPPARRQRMQVRQGPPPGAGASFAAPAVAADGGAMPGSSTDSALAAEHNSIGGVVPPPSAAPPPPPPNSSPPPPPGSGSDNSPPPGLAVQGGMNAPSGGKECKQQ